MIIAALVVFVAFYPQAPVSVESAPLPSAWQEPMNDGPRSGYVPIVHVYPSPVNGGSILNIEVDTTEVGSGHSRTLEFSNSPNFPPTMPVYGVPSRYHTYTSNGTTRQKVSVQTNLLFGQQDLYVRSLGKPNSTWPHPVRVVYDEPGGGAGPGTGWTHAYINKADAGRKPISGYVPIVEAVPSEVWGGRTLNVVVNSSKLTSGSVFYIEFSSSPNFPEQPSSSTLPGLSSLFFPFESAHNAAQTVSITTIRPMDTSFVYLRAVYQAETNAWWRSVQIKP